MYYLKNIQEVLHCYLEGKSTVSLKHCSSARGKRRWKWHHVRITGETVANLWVQPSHSPSETPNSHNRKFLFPVVLYSLDSLTLSYLVGSGGLCWEEDTLTPNQEELHLRTIKMKKLRLERMFIQTLLKMSITHLHTLSLAILHRWSKNHNVELHNKSAKNLISALL